MTSPSRAQQLAASPHHSCWVEASAGTGKTKVLTDRVLNLLLTGAVPEQILCLTFTKAAAAEMANRIQNKLAHWAALGHDGLAQELQNLLSRPPKIEELKRAKKLFSTVIDTPGGMKIQTIHSFCQSILKKFPLEAGIPPHFSVMDDITSKLLLKQSFHQVLETLPEEITQILSKHASTQQLFDLLESLTHKRQKIMALLENHGSLEAFTKDLYDRLGSHPDQSPQDLLAHALSDQKVPQALRDTLLPLQEGTAKDQRIATDLAAFLEKDPTGRAKDFSTYRSLFLTTTGDIRKSFLSSALGKKHPHFHEIFSKEAHRLLVLEEHYHHSIIAEATEALLTFVLLCFKTYQDLKDADASLDYDDLIQRTADLLQTPEIAPWILYKLDGGIQHILVDEAQDTNEDQWRVIAAIASEFFQEEFDPDNPRTLFVVGDMKQSIYSFQGASPLAFQGVKGHFSSSSKDANHNWKEVNLVTSFRSTEPILTLVDHIFQENPKLSPSGMELDYIPHTAHRKDHPGHVEIWPLVTPTQKEERLHWELPNQQKRQTSPRKELAQRMATQIQEWLQNKTLLKSKNRPVEPRDIMILVRRRDRFVDELIRALKNAHVPVTGADRLILTEHIAIMDLLVLGDFLLLPEDDLSLSTILKSPLLDLSEEDLFDLAHNRGGKSLWHTLKARANEKESYQRAFTYLTDLMRLVDFSSPFELYSHILTLPNGRKNMVAHFGTEVEDALEEFLNLCLSFEYDHVISLQEFLSWMRLENVEIKRNLEQGTENKVRIMTVHGSKGLQAPIVFMPDTTQVPLGRSNVFWDDSLLFWCPKARFKTDLIRQLHPQFDEMAEYYRLLYVALTRAEDGLYVCGWEGQRSLDPQSWYQTIRQSAEILGTPLEGDILRIGTHALGDKTHATSTPDEEETMTLPTWIQKPIASETPPSRQSPSTAGTSDLQHNGDGSRNAAYKGTLMHKALEWLMEDSGEERLALVRTYLENHLDKQEAASALLDLKKTMAMPQVQSYFQKGSLLREVDIQSLEKKSHILTKGSIDFLWIDDIMSVIHIIDYKTGNFYKEYEYKSPDIYVEQLSLYRKIIQKIYLNHKIHTFLLWTQVQKLIEITHENG